MSTMLFPLDNAQHYLAGVFPDLDRDGSTLRWSHRGGTSELQVAPLEYPDA